MHQTQMAMPPHHTTAIHPASMHMSAGLPHGATAAGHHFLSSPALASPVGSGNNNHSSNPPMAANAPCSTLFVANLGQFVSEHELKEVFSRGAGMESRHDLLSKKAERELHHQFLMTAPT